MSVSTVLSDTNARGLSRDGQMLNEAHVAVLLQILAHVAGA